MLGFSIKDDVFVVTPGLGLRCWPLVILKVLSYFASRSYRFVAFSSGVAFLFLIIVSSDLHIIPLAFAVVQVS